MADLYHRSGVPFAPSHSTQPPGVVPAAPPHIKIAFFGAAEMWV